MSEFEGAESCITHVDLLEYCEILQDPTMRALHKWTYDITTGTIVFTGENLFRIDMDMSCITRAWVDANWYADFPQLN